MAKTAAIKQEERVLAAAAHGSIILGIFTNGIGGIAGALAVWLTQKEKSRYVANQAIQALAYQAVATVVTLGSFFLWGMLWLVLLLPPIIVNPTAYETQPPPGLWIGLTLLICPVTIWAATILYGLYAAVRAYSGHEFKYAVLGDWLERWT